MKVVVRVDSSTVIGAGHVMRCLVLADSLRGQGASTDFICRDLPGNISQLVEAKGFSVHRLPRCVSVAEGAIAARLGAGAGWLGVDWEQDAEETEALLASCRPRPSWLIVDHYALAGDWESRMRPHVGRIMVVDDLADRCHDCDLLLDPSPAENLESRYHGLVPGSSLKLLGLKYVLLRPEFAERRKRLKKRDGRVGRVLILFGVGDPSNETGKAVEAMRLLKKPDLTVDVVIGVANPHGEEIAAKCAELPNMRLCWGPSDTAELMSQADLAIGAGGTTTWERCVLGLPCIALIIADNQRPIVEAVAARGALMSLGWHQNVTPARIRDAVEHLLAHPAELKKMSNAGSELMAKSEGARIVADTLLGMSHV